MPANEPDAAAQATSTPVPGTELTGPAAFMGPVRTVPVNRVKLGDRQFGTGPDLVLISGDTAPMSLWGSHDASTTPRHAKSRPFSSTHFSNKLVSLSLISWKSWIGIPTT